MTTVITPSSTNNLTYDTVSLNGNLLTSFTYGSGNITFNSNITIYSIMLVSGGNGGYDGYYPNGANYGGNGGAGGTVQINNYNNNVASNSNVSITIGGGGAAGATPQTGGNTICNFSALGLNSTVSARPITTVGSTLFGLTINSNSRLITNLSEGTIGTLYSTTGVYYGGGGGAGGRLIAGGNATSGQNGGIGGGGGGGGANSASVGGGGFGASQLQNTGTAGASQNSGANVTAKSAGSNGSSYINGGIGGSGGGGGGAVRNSGNLATNTALAGTGGNGGTSSGATSGGVGGYGSNATYPGGGGGGGAGGVNTGGGGGGGGGTLAHPNGNGKGGAGGSGIVIIYYKINNQLNASNQDASGFTYTLNSSNYTATLTASPANLQNVNILSDVVSNNYIYNVTSIADNAFLNKTTITAITIPSTVTIIGASTFKGCSGVKTITIPSTIISIGTSAFQSCSVLTTIIVPSTVTSIGASAFYGCTSLVYLSLPGSVPGPVSNFLDATASSVVLTNSSANGITYTISNNQATVSSYTGGTSVSIPINVTVNNVKYPVTSIADNAFNSKSLISILIPPFITSIGNYAFYNNSLTSVSLPPGLISIGTYCFENNYITSAYFPSNLTTISESIFQNNRLVSINISPSLTTIGNYAFSYNYINTINNSTSPSFPATLTSIGQYAFKSNQLSNINIPTNSNFTTLADGVFSDNLLQTVTIPSIITTIGIEVFKNNSITSFTWDSNVTTIPNSMFMGNKFTSIVIPAKIVNIGYAAFMGCNSPRLVFNSTNTLLRIEEAAFRNHQFGAFTSLPTSLTFIGQSAFSLGALTSVIIPSNVTVMDNGAFYGNQLTSVSFANNISSITYLSSSVFENNKLPNFTIPSSVTSIQQFAFNNNRLASVTIPTSVTSIGQYAFAHNELTPLTAPSQTTITSIGYAAFYNNTSVATTLVAGTTVQDSNGIQYSLLGAENNGQYESQNQYIAQVLNSGSLTSIVIPFTIIYNNLRYNITSIANSALSGKTLTSVVLNMNIKSIGQSAFANNNLTSIIIPNSVTAIGDAAFYTNKLTSVNIPTNISYLGGSLFQLNNLTSITIPPNVTGLVDFVFADNRLTSINIPSSIASIPFCAFRNNRLTSIDLSNTNINQIANNAFQTNTITQLSIPSRITSIGQYAFQNNRLSSITFTGTSTITTLPDYAFADNSLNTISIPSSVTIIGNNALQNNFLTNIQLPTNLVYIGQNALQNNRLQSTITIPSSVNYIGDNAFSTNSLSNAVEASYNALVTFSGNNQTVTTTLGGNIFNNNTTTNQKVYITYVYGKKWASTTTALSIPLILLSSSFDSNTNNIQIIIQKAIVTPIISIQNKVYDGTTNATGTFSVNAISLDTLTISGTAAFVNKNAGQNKTVNITNLVLSGDSSSNYALFSTTTTSVASITQKSVTPVITITPKFYDTTTSASFSYSLPDIIALDTNNITLTGTASYADSSAGSNKTVNVSGLLLSGDASSNYALSSSTITTTGTINKKYVYFSIPNKIYDGSSTILKYDLSGVYPSDASNVTASGLLIFENAFVGQDILVNSNNIVLSGSKSLNYDTAYLNNPPYTTSLVRLTGNIIQKALDVSSTFIKTYDGTIAYTNQIDLSGVLSSDAGLVGFTYSSANYDVSTAIISRIRITNLFLSGSRYANYSISQTIDVSGRIFPKQLDISANIVKVYNKNTAYNNRIDASGVILDDIGQVDISYSTPTYNTLNVGTNQVTISNVSVIGAKSQNYTINSNFIVNGVISKKLLDVSASAITKVYDASTSINFIVDLSGVVSGDNVTATVTGNVKSPNVNTYTECSFNNFVLSGTQSGNYDISNDSVIILKNTAIITKKFLTASANVIDKTYNGDTSANVNISLNGILSNNIVTVSSNYIAKYINANAGQSKRVDVSNITLSGDSSNNYDVSSTLLLYGNIVKKSIDVSCTIVTKTYDGSLTATNVPLFLIGTLDNSTNVTFTSANFNTIDTGTNKQVTITGISLYGDTSSNYNLSYNRINVNGIITPKHLDISTNIISKTYDSTNNVSVILSLFGKVQTDVLTVNYTSSLFIDSHVGTSKRIDISGISIIGSSVNNYDISNSAIITGTITPYILGSSNIAGIVSTKIYDASNQNDVSANVQLYLNNILQPDRNNLYVIYNSAFFIRPNNIYYDNSNSLTVRVTGLDLSGSAYHDYSLNISSFDLSGRYVNVIPKYLGIKLNDSSINKIYDGNSSIDVSLSLYDVSLSNPTSNSYVTPPNVTINYVSTNFSDKNVGTNKNIYVTGITLNGSESYLYKTDSSLSTVSLQSLKGIISKKHIDISKNLITKYYDGNQYLYDIRLDLSGTIAEDSLECRGNANFNTSTPGQKNVNMTNIYLTGDSSMNYDLSLTSVDLSGQIYQKLLTVTASKIYDSSNTIYQNDLSLSGIILNENVIINASGEYSRTNPGSIKANIRSISLSGYNSGNYTLNFDSSNAINNINATIYQKQLGLSISKVYDGSTNIISTNVALNGILNNEIVNYSGTGIFADASAGTNINATITNILSGNDKDNYNIDISGVTGNIIRKPLSVVVSSITYNGSNIAYIDNFSITNSLLSNDINRVRLIKSSQISTFYYDSSQVGNRYILNASGNLFITGDLSKNYILDNTQTINAIINRKLIDISANKKVYNGLTNYDVSNIILNNVIPGDNVNLQASSIYIDDPNVGINRNMYIDGSLSGIHSNNYLINSQYLINNLYRISVTILKRPITVGISPKIYDATTTLYNANIYFNNVIIGDDVSVNVTGFYDSSFAGTRRINFSFPFLYGSSSSNYDISKNQAIDASINTRPLGLTILPRYYDGSSTVYLSDFSLNNVIPIDKNNLMFTGKGTYDSKSAGNKNATLYNLLLSGYVSVNYNIATSLQIDASINRLPVTLSSFAKIYDTTPSLNINNIYIKNKITNDIVDVSGYGFYDSSFVGNRIITINNMSLYGSDSSNYIVSTNTQIDGSINPYPVTINVNDKIYDGSSAVTNLSLSGVYSVDINKVSIYGYLLYINNIAKTNKIVDISNNLQNVYLTGDYSVNYYIFNNIYTTGNIYPRPVTIIPTVYDKTYDLFTDANVHLDISGLTIVDNGQYFANYDYANYDNIVVGQSKPISIKNIYITGPYVENYIYDTSLTTFGNILQARLSVNAIPQSKNYDNTNSAIAFYNLNGIFENDNVYITQAYAAFNNKNVGINKTVTMTNFVLSGYSASNYYLDSSLVIYRNANIYPIKLTPSVRTISNKTYDGSLNTSGTIELSGVFSNNVVSANCTFSFRTPDVSNNKPVDVSNIYLLGADASNYELSFTYLSGTSNITPLQLRIIPYTKPYDGTTYVDISNIQFTGMLNGESISFGGSAVFDSQFVGSRNIQVNTAYLIGNGSNNYTIQSSQTVPSTITKRKLTILVNDKIYDGTQNIDISNLTISGIQNNDNIVITRFALKYANANVGNNISII